MTKAGRKQLNPSQVYERVVRLEVIARERRALDAKLAEQRKAHKAAITALDEERRRLQDEILDASVEFRPNFETRRVECYRKDNGKPIWDLGRDMTSEELQMSFDDVALAAK